MPAVGLRKLVPPIAGTPSPYGLLGGCVEVVTASDLHELNGTDMLSLSCAEANPWYDCPPADSGLENPASKVFDRPATCSFEPVTAYAGVTCSTFGLTYEEGQQRALEQLAQGEQRVLEEHFMRRFLCTVADDLTPAAGALSVPAGVGALEGWLATNYGGQGVLHVPAGAAALLGHHRVLDFDGATYRTLAGNCVVIGAGYAANVGPATPPATGCVVAPAGEAWLYITPPVRVRRDSPALTTQDERRTINTSTNDRYALAETTFVPETACCIAAAVRVTLC